MSCSVKWKLLRAGTTEINRATPRHGLEHYCRDLNGWPRSWMRLEKDLPPGEQLLALFRPFLEYLAASNLTPKTIQKHVDNMWHWVASSSATSVTTRPCENGPLNNTSSK
jgi:hypothetical protein